ncbi:MAG: glycosyltransferase family 2 protein [Planctomycetes bacterium]|nr:glycosyltransferase family 2 protein [Planctomycetota bacterium]
MSRVGVVAIGRNEGQRLVRCLQSVIGRAVVVYVDSGSTDGSVAAARALGAEVVELDMSIPFTAARARNAGFARLCDMSPDVEYVQFLDGDCEVAPNWLEQAAKELDRRPELGAVCGRLRERFPEASIYNRLCDIEWDIPLGEIKACGGNSFARVEAVNQVEGYNPTLIAAEDDEFCLRLRRIGWKIVRLVDDMATHDAAMTRAGQWWKRAVRCGFAYANGAALHGRGPERHFVRERRRVVVWGFGVPATAAALAWPTGGLSLGLFALYPLQLARTYRGLRKRGFHRSHALAYATSCVVGRVPQVLGLVKFYLGQARGLPTRIIEYKSKGTV